MKEEVLLLAALGVLAALAGIWFLRRSPSGADAQSGTTLLGWVFCFVAAMLILIAAAGSAWS